MQSAPSMNSLDSKYQASSAGAKLIKITREFNVPVEELFKSFTNSEDLKIWWWPQGLFSDHIEIDFRNQGRYFINMKGYDQGGGGMTGKFEEIIPNKRIVMTDQFADEKGRAISAQEAHMPGEWPEMIYITFEFEALTAERSRFRLLQTGIPNELQEDCIKGWQQSFDKLQDLLNDRKHL